MNKKITLSVLAILVISIAIVGLYKTFAYNVTSTMSGTTLNFDLVTNTEDVTVPANSSKELVYKIQNENRGTVKYEVFHNISNPNISVTKVQGGDLQSGTINKNEYKFINIRINNSTSSEVTVTLFTVFGFENGGDLIVHPGLYPIEGLYKNNVIEFISSLGEGAYGNGGIYAVEHRAIPASSSATGREISSTVDYRYYGRDPDNYFCFDSSCSDGMFRIIGLVYDELFGSLRVKIISKDPIQALDGTDTFAWNKTMNSNDSSHYRNIWAPNNTLLTVDGPNSGSTLMSLLNNEWISGGTITSYFNETEEKNLTFNRKETIYGNANLARRYLGAIDGPDYPATLIYTLERGTERYDDLRPLYWNGGASLMSLSDYAYASKVCFDNHVTMSNYDSCTSDNWLFSTQDEYVINALSGFDSKVYYISSTGAVDVSDTYVPMHARVVLYLTEEVKVVSGSGSILDPYIFGK